MGYRIPITLGNIEPLASKPFRPGKMALVCEGGGQRGIFTAGVLDEFQRAGFNPFDLLIGTSAGADAAGARRSAVLRRAAQPGADAGANLQPDAGTGGDAA